MRIRCQTIAEVISAPAQASFAGCQNLPRAGTQVMLSGNFCECPYQQLGTEMRLAPNLPRITPTRTTEFVRRTESFSYPRSALDLRRNATLIKGPHVLRSRSLSCVHSPALRARYRSAGRCRRGEVSPIDRKLSRCRRRGRDVRLTSMNRSEIFFLTSLALLLPCLPRMQRISQRATKLLSGHESSCRVPRRTIGEEHRRMPCSR